VLNLNMIESAIARPRNRRAYYPGSSLFELAAAYCVGIGKNHGFVDGNKRTAFLAAATFLRRNGWSINPPGNEVVDLMVRVGEGQIDEEEVAAWFSRYAQKRRQS
jgi:death on curing protein